MSLYAMLHDGPPGAGNRDSVMSATYPEVFLSVRFSAWNVLTVTMERITFLVAWDATPLYVTLWEGARCHAMLTLKRTDRARGGDTVYVDYAWTMDPALSRRDA